MNQNYTKKRENYNDNLFFDTDIYETQAELPQFNLERLARNAAQRIIQEALEMEVSEFLERGKYQKTLREDFRGYRNGHHKQRTIATSFGSLEVKVPRVSDSTEKFQSNLVKKYRRRSEGLDCLFPNLFVEGLATRDFEPALRFLVGESAPLSPSSISRLNKKFKDEYESWRKRDLSDLKIVYLWADGIYLKAGIADEKRCLLVIIGVDISGTKHLLALEEGFRESAESWYNVLIDLQKRGLNEPALALADGGLGFWAALPKVWRQTREQLCWLHKMRNILDKLPKSEHSEAVLRLRGIYSASSREAAERLAKQLLADWKKAEYYQAIECLFAALPRLLTFYEFPAEHHRHLRTTNVIESPFASVRLRTDAAKRFRSARSGTHLVFKIMESCEKRWQRVSHPEKLKEVKLPEKES
ncbi:MAG: IS256 family transposase [Acidobacteria bacterium]|nr:IS256 family transposase [Acidobacteriota bacterium]